MTGLVQQSEAFFREITHNSSEIVIAVDKDGKILFVNSAVERFLGYPPQSLIGKSAFDFIAPAELSRAIEDFSAALATQGETPNAFHVTHRDGSHHLFEGLGANLLNNPNVNGFVMNVRDVTDREAAESALRESEKKFRDLTEKAAVGIYVLQGKKFRYVNAKFAEMHGYMPGEMIHALSVKDLCHPDDLSLVREFSLEEREGEAHTYYAELRALKKSGELFNIEIHGTATQYRGKPAIIGTAIDITARKQAEELIERRQALLEDLVAVRTADLEMTNKKLEQEILENNRIREAVTLAKVQWERTFDTVPDLIAIIDPDYHIVRVNRAMAEKSGISFAQAIGMKCCGLIHGTEGPPPYCPYALLQEDGREHTSEICIDHWRGTYEVSASPLYDENGDLWGCVHVARDITERKQKKELLQKMVQERTDELSQKNRELINEIIGRKHVEADLRKKAADLQSHAVKMEELNTTLKVLLSKREEDRADLEDKVLSNVKHLLRPHLETLKTKRVDDETRKILEVLEANINKLTSSFSQKLSSHFPNFTPTEIKVADLVKEGKTIKEIAAMLSVSHFAIDLHRFNIRKKLGLKDRKTNLRTYLLSLS